MSDSLRPHGLQHARLPCPLPYYMACRTPKTEETNSTHDKLQCCGAPCVRALACCPSPADLWGSVAPTLPLPHPCMQHPLKWNSEFISATRAGWWHSFLRGECCVWRKYIPLGCRGGVLGNCFAFNKGRRGQFSNFGLGPWNTNVLMRLVTAAGFVTPKEILVNHKQGRSNLATTWGESDSWFKKQCSRVIFLSKTRFGRFSSVDPT